MIIVSTSYIGSYFVIRGIAAYVGFFPDTYKIFLSMQDWQWFTVDSRFYYWVGGIGVLWIVSAAVQFKVYCSLPEHAKHPYNVKYGFVYQKQF